MIFRLLLSFILLSLIPIQAQSQDVDWVLHAGEQNENVAHSVTTDAAGNSFVSGYFYEAIKLGDKVLQGNTKTSNAFIAKFDPHGNLLWAQAARGLSRSYAIAVDKDGNSYMTGYTFDYVTFSDQTVGLKGNSDLFVAKYSSTGQLLWITTDVASFDFGRDLDIKVDAAGNSYIAGGVIASTGATYYNASYVGGYVIKLDNEGKLQYKKGFANAIAYHLALDNSGNRIYLIGNLVKSTKLGNHQLTSAGMTDVFVARLSSVSGDVEWVQQLGGSQEELGRGIAVDKQGNCYISSLLKGDISVQNISVTTHGDTDILLAKFSPDGRLEWAQSAGSTAGDDVTDLTLDKSGNVYITGLYKGTASFGMKTFTAVSALGNVYVAKYTPLGSLKTFHSLAGNGEQISKQVAVDLNDNIFIGGSITGTVKFGEFSVEAKPSELFLAKIAAEKSTPEQPAPPPPQQPVPTAPFAIKLPNIITPNGDGLNDTFKVVATGDYQVRMHFTVYNSFGVQVYKNIDYANNWSADGLATGAYYYTLAFPFEEETKVYKGWVEVIR